MHCRAAVVLIHQGDGGGQENARLLALILAYSVVREVGIRLRDTSAVRSCVELKVSVAADPHSGRGQGGRILPCSRGGHGASPCEMPGIKTGTMARAIDGSI